MLIKTGVAAATDTKGKRTVAMTVEDMPVIRITPWNHALNMEDNHELAAANLLITIGLDHLSVGLAATKNGDRFFIVEGEN